MAFRSDLLLRQPRLSTNESETTRAVPAPPEACAKAGPHRDRRRRTTCVWGRGLEAFTGRLQKSLFFVEREAGWKKMARRNNVACDERFLFVRTSAGRESPSAADSRQKAPLFDVRKPRPGYARIHHRRQHG